MAKRYEPAVVEAKWQRRWEANKTFKAVDCSEKPKYYVLDMFPYPSGAGLHVGHPEGYTATDIVSRYKRMRGYNVLHPMGWDAFGLPTEQYAIQTGQHPADITQRNIDTFRRQLKMLGFSYDWDREISTIDPGYYKWTQWIFLQLHKMGLAYVDEVPVNWCPALGTVLANEEVIDGRSERGNHPVYRKPMRQWILRITKYADRLLEDLEDLDWPESVKEMQRNWIGRSVGTEVRFAIEGHPGEGISVFTTRADTLFGATYMVLAPEHPLIDTIVTDTCRRAVLEYRAAAVQKSDIERTDLIREKTGVSTGAYAINPANGQTIPIWVADYVLASYGTGAIMAVPGHDQRDWEFARKYRLPVVEVVRGGNLDDGAYAGDGPHVNSSFIDGLNVEEAIDAMNEWLEARQLGRRKVTYRLRDWVFSRQRYWGEPFPVIYLEDGTIRALDESALPVELPQEDSVKPSGTGESPLANLTEWVDTVDPETGRPARRETNTMPNWAGSCWYFLRYIDPHNDDVLVSPEKERYWMPVDLYVGGVEHAVLHLLYARFWHKVLYDLGVVHTKEPFKKLVNQGMILGLSYADNRGALVPADFVVHRDGGHFHRETGEPLTELPAKMSKSLKNVINPDDVVKKYGADTLRAYEMFMGPLEASKAWDTKGVEGVYRFLLRVWRLVHGWDRNAGAGKADTLLRVRHQTIKKVTHDIEAFRFNTAIAQLMIYVNEMYKAPHLSAEDLEVLTLLLSPIAPHICEECWERLGHTESLAYHPWPEYVEAYTLEEMASYGIQVNGKVRGQLEVPAGTPKHQVLEQAKAHHNVARYLAGKQVVKEIFVPGKLVSLVVR